MHLELSRKKKELRESYEQLRELEILRDSLVNMIVHDLRSPLMAIGGFLELLEMKECDNLSERGEEFIQKARQSTASMVEMAALRLDASVE